MIEWVTSRAPTASCLSADGSARSIAAKFAIGHRAPDATLVQRARTLQHQADAGRVQSMGDWQDAAVYTQLGQSLGHLSTALRSGFEWYQCRGAFFHNDAHYDARMFGVWYIAGPPAELVFPRAATRSPISTGSLVIFDPFEVHGVLAPGCVAYSADDYECAEPSIFLGFELDLTPEVSAAFGIDRNVGGVIISSKTRVCATSGALISD
jgi:hypothetical protein